MKNLQVLLVNIASDYTGQVGQVDEKEWGDNKFWVKVKTPKVTMLMCRSYLRPI